MEQPKKDKISGFSSNIKKPIIIAKIIIEYLNGEEKFISPDLIAVTLNIIPNDKNKLAKNKTRTESFVGITQPWVGIKINAENVTAKAVKIEI